MAKVTDGLKKLALAQLIPEDEYELIIDSVVTGMGNDNWEKVWCKFVNPPDQKLLARRISHMIGSPDTSDWRGLTEILSAAQLEEVPGGDYGEGDTRNLVGVTFRGRVFHRQGNRGQEAAIVPIVDSDWLSKLSAEDGDEPPKRRRRKASKRS